MFADKITDYLRTLNNVQTRESYERALIQFHRWYVGSYGEEPDLALLTGEEAREWRHHLATVKKLAASTVNQRLAALRGIVRHYGRQIHVKGMKKVTPPVDPLNGRELGRMLATVEGDGWMARRDTAILELMVRAGLRVNEVVSLQLDDIYLSERKGSVLIRQGKGMKERTIPLGSLVRSALQLYIARRPVSENQTLFVSRTGKRLDSRDVQRMVNRAARRAGVSKEVTPHLLRHTFATRALQKDVDLATLSHLLGHENLSTTSRYLHPNQSQVAEMIEDL